MAKTLAGSAGWVVFLALLVGMFLVAWFGDTIVGWFSRNPSISGAQLAWLVGMIVIGGGVLITGIAVNGRWSGVFIDSRNRYSLSQVQAVLWLIVVSSGIVAAGIGNVHRGDASPLDLGIPAELFAILGLSVTTLVGTPLIRNIKRDNDPADQLQTTRTMSNLGAERVDATGPQVFGFSVAASQSPDLATEGTVVTFADPRQTGWSDLVRGEETGNADKVDLGKLQLLYISAVVIFVYCASLFTNLNPPLDEAGHAARLVFADLDASFVGLLGVSHAGALAYLAAPHANTAT